MAVRELVAIRFQAGLHTVDNKAKGWATGNAKYPDFNQVSLANRSGMDWCKYIDAYGIGMQYDRECGHKEQADHSPIGEQCCVLAAPEAFVLEAMSKLPGLVRLTEAEFINFYDNVAHAHEEDDYTDTDALNAIAAKEANGLPVPEKSKAFDRNDKAHGVRKNHNKRWADKKKIVGVEVV
jgi:hypothetical protein